MYDPTGNGRQNAIDAVQFLEAEPPANLRSVVHRFLELKTDGDLEMDYTFHALPDACTYMVFDQHNSKIAGVTNLRASSEEMNLGRRFHYTNIRFLPGVWQGNGDQADYGMVDSVYMGTLPLRDVNRTLQTHSFASKQALLSDFVTQLVEKRVVVPNPVTERIFQQIDDIHTVADMAEISQISPRQLQRILKKTTGFAPHDFLKVIRLQQSLHGEPSLSYADQSHFIHSFRKATGYTPGQYARKFDV